MCLINSGCSFVKVILAFFPAVVLSVTVIQKWRKIPGPSISAKVIVSPAFIGTEGDPFLPIPR